MSDKNGWIGVDLDGTLAYYDEWRGIEHIGKPIIPMVIKVKQMISAGFDVKIFTARCVEPTSIPFIEKWCLEHLGVILPITNIKDFGMIELYDDRCVQIVKNTGLTIEEMLNKNKSNE